MKPNCSFAGAQPAAGAGHWPHLGVMLSRRPGDSSPASPALALAALATCYPYAQVAAHCWDFAI